ncbi:MAG: preprotein translocase subunit YajC [Clostridiales bacterium]|jgi:preprotein translocase subunit YajC|nr:preprotein translocase subunit YajC [Clostridiales bacterium]
MDLSNFTVLLEEVSPILQAGGESATSTTAGTGTGQSVDGGGQVPPTEQSALGFFPIILQVVVLLGAMYFLLIRPQRKQAKELKTLQENIRPGDNVVTTSGFYGKVMDIGEDVFVVEFGTNRGIRVPVSKSEITAIKSPKMTPPPAVPKE